MPKKINMKQFMKMKYLSLLSLLLLALSCSPADDGVEETAEAPQATYKETYRPQFHFSPPTQWMNDPNGMVYYEGEYHLFYQHHPYDNVWGPMHWGHAVSEDLVYWENLPIALYPVDSLGTIFSGSAVVDWKNTSGLGQNDEPPLVAIFTFHDSIGEKVTKTNTYQTQGIAYSNDKGRIWTHYEGNPVIENPGIRDFRDPKVAWHEESQQWVMALAVLDRIAFFTSPNLIDWNKTGEFGVDIGGHGGVWECPDLFELPIEGTYETRWVLLVSINPGGPNSGSATQYFIGDFDGKNFNLDPDFADYLGETPSSEKEKAVWLDYGRDNYAGVTWSDISDEDGRRLFIGWMSNWEYGQVVPTTVWRSAMTLPRKLELHETPEGLRVFSKPVKELEVLRKKVVDIQPEQVGPVFNLSEKYELIPRQLELELEFALDALAGGRFGIQLSNESGEIYQIGFDAGLDQFFSDRTKARKESFSEKFPQPVSIAPRLTQESPMRIHLFIDEASIELFADDGATVMTELFFPIEPFTNIDLFAEKGSVGLTGGKAYTLSSIWK